MSALRNLIIALVILGAGIFAIQRIGEAFLKQPGLPTAVGQFGELIAATRGLTNTILIGIGVLVVLLIIIWIVRKVQARRATRQPTMPALPELPPEAPPEEEREKEE